MIESQITYVPRPCASSNTRGRKHSTRVRTRRPASTPISSENSPKVCGRKGGCKNWYLDAKGVNRTIWPGFTWRYWLDTRKVNAEDFELIED